MDTTVLVRCITIIIVLILLVFLLTRGKLSGLKIKTGLGELELGVNNKTSASTETSAKVSNDKKVLGYSLYTVKRELKNLIFDIVEDATQRCIPMFIQNDIHLKTQRDMDKYISELINELRLQYEDALKKSEIFKDVNTDAIFNSCGANIRIFIENGFSKIYNSHKENYATKEDGLKDISIDDITVIQKIEHTFYVDNLSYDIEIFLETLKTCNRYFYKTVLTHLTKENDNV